MFANPNVVQCTIPLRITHVLQTIQGFFFPTHSMHLILIDKIQHYSSAVFT